MRLPAIDSPGPGRCARNAIVTDTVSDQQHKVCFLFNTALEIATHDEEVRPIVIDGVSEIEAFFRHSVELGQNRSEMSETLDPPSTA